MVLCKIKTMQDVVSLGLHLPMAVRDELVRSTAILDYEYGPARNDTDGGYSILLN